MPVCPPFLSLHQYLPENLKASKMAADISNCSIPQLESRTLLLHSSQQARSWLDSLAGWSTWQYVVTFLLAVVVYDQGNKGSPV
jgi:hypothetical protein